MSSFVLFVMCCAFVGVKCVMIVCFVHVWVSSCVMIVVIVHFWVSCFVLCVFLFVHVGCLVALSV